MVGNIMKFNSIFSIMFGFISIFYMNVSLAQSALNWTMKNSKLSYEVNFFSKTVHGLSKKSQGKGLCSNKSDCQFIVAAPILSFDSGDGNRDAKMFKVTRTGSSPYVQVKLSFKKPKKWGVISVDAEIHFAGVKKVQKVKINIHEISDKLFKVTAKFTISLKNYDIEAPSLMLVKIDDEIPIVFTSQWKLLN